MTLADNIRALREKKGLTQIEFAEKAGIPQATYSRLERKGNDITYEQLEKVAEALNCEVADIFFYGDSEGYRKYISPEWAKDLEKENGDLKKEVELLKIRLDMAKYLFTHFYQNAVGHAWRELLKTGKYIEENVFTDPTIKADLKTIYKAILQRVYQYPIIKKYKEYNLIDDGMLRQTVKDFMKNVEIFKEVVKQQRKGKL